MTWLRTILVLTAAFLAVFWEAAFQGVRHLAGVQIDLLPGLMVYASLQAGLRTVCLLALVGGLLFDSLSANPLGITVLPLLAVGGAYYAKHDLIVRDQAFAQAVLGFLASLAVPAMTLTLLLSTGRTPLLGWGTLWQILFMGVSGAVATPLTFIVFDWLERTLGHSRASEPSFRPDREIRRGR
jgi:rod shape-determining protein MreD